MPAITWEQVPPHIREVLEVSKGKGIVRKTKTAEQIVVGWASVAELGDGTVVEDWEGDIIPLDELTKAVDAFMAKPAAERVLGVGHARANEAPVKAGEVLEMFMVTPEVKKSLGLDPSTLHGALMAAHVAEPLVWEAVEAGALRMFSIHGTATREAGPLVKATRPGSRTVFDLVRERR